MRLRKHQAEFSMIIDALANSRNLPGVIQDVEKLKTIILRVTPGGGKSFIPIVAGRLIGAGKADALCWIVPRQALQDQGEREFLDPLSRKLFNHNMAIRSATNDVNPCRGTNGFVTTYQALGVDARGTVAEDFAKKRYVLILDEYHHVEKGGIWHKALEPLYRNAAYVILMTGTLERGDGQEIAFTKYVNGYPLLSNTEDTAVIQYTRQDALMEQAILPISFHMSDGHFEWADKVGDRQKVDSFSDAKKESEKSAALYTALNTGFAAQLLREAVLHWQRTRNRNPRAKLLVVTADYQGAKTVTEILQRALGLKAEIATSHASKEAVAAIKRFKGESLDILVTIAMAYEGLSVPPVTHISCLTHIRSTPWIEQMVARAVRIDPLAGPYATQRAHVFAPKDTEFVAIVRRIEQEQVAVIKKQSAPYDHEGVEVATIPSEGDGEGLGTNGPDITPISSGMTDTSEYFMGIDPQQEMFASLNHVSKHVGEPEQEIETLKEQEIRIRQEISKHVNRFAFEHRYEPQRINAELKLKWGGVSRDILPLDELKKLQSYVREVYPLDYKQPLKTPPPGVSLGRAKRPRVSTRVVPWPGSREEMRQQAEKNSAESRLEKAHVFARHTQWG